jgi:hypothetical protein
VIQKKRNEHTYSLQDENIDFKTGPLAPKPNTRIWRYMSLHAFLTLATDRYLMFRQFKELQNSDAREGMVPDGFWESMLDFYREQQPQADITEFRQRSETTLNKLRCFGYASCWSMSAGENALMWKAYAPQGIAVRTTVKKFRNAKQPAGNELSIRAHKMEYADHWSDLRKCGYWHTGIPLNRLFLHTKRRAFVSERAVRFSIAPAFPFLMAPDGTAVPPDPNKCPPWFPVRFENLNWIEEVVAESSIPNWAVETIRKLADQQNIKFRGSEI